MTQRNKTKTFHEQKNKSISNSYPIKVIIKSNHTLITSFFNIIPVTKRV